MKQIQGVVVYFFERWTFVYSSVHSAEYTKMRYEFSSKPHHIKILIPVPLCVSGVVPATAL